MKQRHNSMPNKRVLTVALMLAIAAPAMAQEAGQPATSQDDAQTLDTVTVSGIRGSLLSSMNLKRDSQGVVDGIVAEDIGKFPDTNLAESLQRISGVSIDRSLGEGSRITVRGVGPDFNMVTLNGRQMPASSIGDTYASSSRAFDFANLASEAVSEIEVHKTGRAANPTGGLGATVNIRTTRPLDNPGLHANVGLKGVYDTSGDEMPSSYDLSKVTPEISGIFSNTSADGRFGVALSASRQEREFGYSQASVGNGWNKHTGADSGWGALPAAGTPTGDYDIINQPGVDDVYGLPQNFGYAIVGAKRQRTNGQLTLQYAPTDRVTATLDYTYAENKIQQQRNELSVWFNYGPGSSAWTDGPIAGPIHYGEYIEAANSDIAMAGGRFATVNENKSLGFNVEWDVTDSLELAFDLHRSTAESAADSPYGSNATIGTAAFIRGTTSVDFSRDLPLLSITLPDGRSAVEASDMVVTGSSFRNSYMKSEVTQAQASGTFHFENYSRLDFGIGHTEVENRTAYAYTQRDTWGGIPGRTAADYPDSLWTADNMNRYFKSFGGNIPSGRFFTFDFDALRDLVADQAGDQDLYLAPTEFTTDRRTTEKSRSAYVQWGNTFDLGLPLHAMVGVRYEETEVTSSALVPIATGIEWAGANEYVVQFSDPGFTTLRGKYDYWLPNLDLRLELRDNLMLRGSYGRSIGRPGWNDIQGGQTLDALARVDGGTGQQGDPALKPLESDNFDLSLEWYYGEGSFVSAGYFRKNIDNYIGTSTVVESPFGLNTPANGAYFNQAVAAGCASTNADCIRSWIFTNLPNAAGVDVANQTISGQPGDPIANFRITVPTNERSASLDGWEFNVQHMFGDSGFGVQANYTIVDSGLTYDNYSLGSQFALVGLSDSANLVGFYDKGPWQVRAAYNWRDEFLSATQDGGGANPQYVEAYGQFDLSIGYAISERLTLQLEGINLTDETMRVHGRHSNQLLYATQTGPRYMFGLRYKFF